MSITPLLFPERALFIIIFGIDLVLSSARVGTLTFILPDVINEFGVANLFVSVTLLVVYAVTFF